ncbi:hypothetical protein D9613_004431 [Agrocybe pediades]|uniref:F-box domain-containing protein n=1 Tax=Agrocybe pediades TaxID=84607 RepID=A0A8H4VKQ5_9AGAR|nr:hypothetical protein D9613_004431 [Agrocybe pediades]
MTCPHRKASGTQSEIINISLFKYNKSECPIEDGNCRLCREIQAIEKDVEDIAIRLKNLLSRHQQLRTETNHTHSPIIRDLPVEILSKIFYSCFSDGMMDADGEGPSWSDTDVPLRVGAVCRTWRQVAWSSPELWTAILVKRTFTTASHVCNQYPIMTGWIHRSRVLPVYITLYENTEDGTKPGSVAEGCDCWERTLQLVAECSDRWKDADLNLSRASFEYIASNLKLKPPTRKLALESDEPLDKSTVGTEVLKLWQEPEFGPQSMTIDLFFRLEHLNLNWQYLTDVNACSWHPDDCVDLLRNAPQLVSCSFTDIADYWEEAESNVSYSPLVIHHTSLRYLSLHCEVFGAAIFDQLTAPSLEELWYTTDSDRLHPIESRPFLMSFFRRSSFPLTQLKLNAHTFPPEYLMAILSSVPSLVHLYLSFSSGTVKRPLMVSLFNHLATTAISSSEPGSDAVRFLPQLEDLKVTGDFREADFPWTCVPDAFGYPPQLGREGQRPFKSLALVVRHPYLVKGVPGDMVARLVNLQNAGFNINFMDGSALDKLVPVTWE